MDPVAPQHFDDLPEHRRHGLLYHFARWPPDLDYDDIAELAVGNARGPCQWRPYTPETSVVPSGSNPRAQIRLFLIGELGEQCHACHEGPAVRLDHDHLTGMVRGVLCPWCNAHIDGCSHLSGCPWAGYLNDPPAACYALPFPSRGRPKPTQQQRLGRVVQLLDEHARKPPHEGRGGFTS